MTPIEAAARARHPSIWDGRAKADLLDPGHYVNTPPPTPERADEVIERMKEWAMRDAATNIKAALDAVDLERLLRQARKEYDGGAALGQPRSAYYADRVRDQLLDGMEG